MELFGVKFVGFNEANGQKLLLTFIFVVSALIIKSIIRFFLQKTFKHHENLKIRFWARQGINLFFAFIITLTVLSIWFDDAEKVTTGLGLMTAGLAFALQKVVTSFAGYLIIMRGNTFSVGERITMGGIRGDVISLGFLQTTIMEMGQPPSVQGADPAMWIKGRQFTGRIVTVTNDKIFENAVFNYTRDFPFIWEELSIPVKYDTDRDYVEKLMIETVKRHTDDLKEAQLEWGPLIERKYGINTNDITPKVFVRLTDNWLEMTIRFITGEHGVRDIKDKISRDILNGLEARNIDLASATYEIVGLPKVKLSIDNSQQLNKENKSNDLRN